MQSLEPLQLTPPPDANDTSILQMIRSSLSSESHHSGTCSMLPLNLGGVVSPELLVYGTQNLRVVDASIMPMVPACHLQSVMYAIGEKVRYADSCNLSFADFLFRRRTSSRLPTTRRRISIHHYHQTVVHLWRARSTILLQTPPRLPQAYFQARAMSPQAATAYHPILQARKRRHLQEFRRWWM